MVIVAGLLAFYSYRGATSDGNPTARTFRMPQAKIVSNVTVGDSDYEWSIRGTDTPLDGVSVDFPEGALPAGTRVSIGYSQDNSIVPENSKSVSPQVHLNASVKDEFFQPVTITIPYSNFGNPERVVALYFDEDLNAWDAAPLAVHDFANNSISIETLHFSLYFLTEVLDSSLTSDTGYAPSRDGWDIENTGSYLTEGGNCLGMSSYSKWYFQRKGGGLAGTYDAPIEPYVATRAHLAECQVWAMLQFGITYELSGEKSAGVQLAALLLVTNLPQIVILGTNGTPKHAVLAYGYSGQGFMIYDPNFPSQARNIQFSVGSGFSDYSSGTHRYNSFGYYGLPALGVDEKFVNIDSDARNGFYGSGDLTITSPSQNAEFNEETVQVEGTVKGKVADATHVAVYSGSEEFGTTIQGGSFSIEVPLNLIGKIDLFVLAGKSKPMLSSDSAMARVTIHHDLGVRLLVTLTWNEFDTDVDLYVTEPDGESVWYRSKNAATGGSLDVDDTNGYGPEHYTLDISEGDDIEDGDYVVQVHYYSDHDHGLTAHCTVTVINYDQGQQAAVFADRFVISYDSSSNYSPGSSGSDWHYVTTVRLAR